MNNFINEVIELRNTLSNLIDTANSGKEIATDEKQKIESLLKMYNCPITEGTEVFVLNQNKRIYKTKCDGYAINKNKLHILLLDEYDDMFTSWFPIEEFNKTFFLTYEEAEKATLIPSSEKIEFKPSDELQQPKWVNTSESLQNSILDKKDREIDEICDTGRFDTIIKGYCLLVLDANDAIDIYRKNDEDIYDYLKFYSANDARSREFEEENRKITE